jgi:hypothetical protein
MGQTPAGKRRVRRADRGADVTEPLGDADQYRFRRRLRRQTTFVNPSNN